MNSDSEEDLNVGLTLLTTKNLRKFSYEDTIELLKENMVLNNIDMDDGDCLETIITLKKKFKKAGLEFRIIDMI